ncbi:MULTISPECIES: 2TM domain-containing protein [Chryseobacterium]|uniref:2TM domain-containing protein n=1 Tax=Chryseobacterium candidae TaxID=1978493 RepID=A0ABY2R2M4_9FLAO|nr:MULTISPECIES: 2TM domain-containing protein [Chryseobacterium]PXW14363.1 2TM domain-containing protein [Chryseobacterium sp. CBTAP 102]THV56586.1 2TM domain-containing protein [Chryseobacterium candidae]
MDYETASERTNSIRKFYKSIFIFALFAVLIIPDDIFGEKIIHLSLFDRYTILAIWAFIILVKAAKLFLFDSEWENNMIEKELRKDKRTIKY